MDRPISNRDNHAVDEELSALYEHDSITKPVCLDHYLSNIAFVSQSHALSSESNTQDLMKWLWSVLSKSPVLCQLLNEIDTESWKIAVSKDVCEDYMLDLDQDLLILPSRLPHGFSNLRQKPQSQSNLLLNAIRALRDIWFEDHHFDVYERLAAEEWLKWERIRSADIDTFTVLVIWELRVAGEATLWRHLMGSENGDMAMIFQAVKENEGLSNEKALLHTFRQWFMNEERINDTDSNTLNIMDETVLHLNLIEPFGTEKLKGQEICDRLTIGDEISYLEDIESMLSNPDFCSIPNEINQTHFFHIMNDLETVHIEGLRFRDKSLAEKIFPNN